MRRPLAMLGALVMTTACGFGNLTSPTPRSTATTQAPNPTAAPTPTPASHHGPGPSPVPGVPIGPNVRTEVTVLANDIGCFYNWDASGRCRQLDFSVPVDGSVQATLELPSASRGFYDPEVFLVAPNGTWEVTVDAWPTRHVMLPGLAGQTFRVVVIAYGPFPDTVFVSMGMQ